MTYVACPSAVNIDLDDGPRLGARTTRDRDRARAEKTRERVERIPSGTLSSVDLDLS